MKLRLLTVILLIAALFSGVVLWRVDRFVYGDRLAWAEAQGRSQMSSMTQALNAEIQSSRRLLNSLSPDTFRKDRTNWNSLQPYYGLALMTTQPGGGMSITQMVSKDGSPAAGWTATDLTKYIGFIGKELENRSAVILRAFTDPKKNRHVAVIFAGNGRAYLLIGNGANFQAMIESQRGSMNSFMIVAADGLTISHSIREYVGTVMSDSAILKEIRSTGSAQGLGTYNQGRKKVFGMYEQVPGTNSYIISTLPMEELLKGRMSLTWQFVFLVLGFGLVGSAIYFWVEKRQGQGMPIGNGYPTDVLPSPPGVRAAAMNGSLPPSARPAAKSTGPASAQAQMQKAPQHLVPTAPQHSVPTIRPPSSEPPGAVLKAPPMRLDMPHAEPKPEQLQQERNEAFRQVAAAMGQEMRAPLASILGFSQMVLAKTQDPEVVQAVDSILREARSSRDVLEKLYTFAGERQHPKAEVKIEGPLMQALKNLDAKLQEKGVKVEKDFQNSSPWKISSQDLTTAFENIIINSIEAMERMPDKHLRLSVWEDGEGLHVRIADTGEGIEVENLEKVFDPFFTTRSFSQHVGLGLPVVVGVLKEHGAQIKVHSQRAKGTTVDMIFVKQAEKPAAPMMAPPAKGPMRADQLPSDLPKVEKPVAAKETKAAPEPEVAAIKLTDVNVDTLLDMGPDDPPLQFLAGQGFEVETPPMPPPRRTERPSLAPTATVIVPTAVTAPTVLSPQTATENQDEVTSIIAPTPIVEEDTQPNLPLDLPSLNVELPRAPDLEATQAPTAALPTEAKPQVEIDSPTRPAPQKTSALDSYKVEIRRPGKRT